MKTVVILMILSVLLLNTFPPSNACGGSGSGGGGSSGGSSRRSYGVGRSPRGKKVSLPGGMTGYIGKTGLRDRDKTGHKTGLGTLAKSLFTNPRKTVGAVKEFSKSYNKMRKANVKGGNIPAHEEANRKATKIAGPKVSSAISAFREQYKNFRVGINPDKTIRIGDTRTKEETANTMNANQRGREKGIADSKKNGGKSGR